MRRYYLISIIFLSLNSQIFPQDWIWQNPIPTNNSLYGIKFLNDSIAYCVGDGGFIMKSSDAGLTWESINSSITYYLNDIFFIDEYNFVAVGNHATIIKSFDGGVTWQRIDSGLWEYFQTLTDVFFIDQNVGWISCVDHILKSTDSGNSWNTVFSFHGGIRFYSIHFFDLNNGILLGQGAALYSTSDGGINWEFINTGYSGFRAMFIHSPDESIVVGENGLIIKTTDGGNTWEQKNSGTNNSLRAIDFKDETTGIVVGVDGTIVTTTDAGETWTNVSNQYEDFDNLYATSINTAGIVLSVGIRGELVRSTDDGFTWNRIRQGYLNNLNSIYMLSRKEGWIVGDEGLILRTTNGGNNWVRADSITNETLRDILFISDSVGWIVGYSGNVFKTYNGGQTWEPVDQFGNININSIFFADENTGWVAGSSGSIYKTTDGGAVWLSQTSGTNNNLTSTFFTDENNGWSVSAWSSIDVIIKTTNGGENWEINRNATDLFSISFIDSSTGWAVGGQDPSDVEDIGAIYKTTNSGLSWTKYDHKWGYYFYDLIPLDTGSCWIFGRILAYGGNYREGIIAYTTDGGESLVFLESSAASPLVSASIIDETQIWVVGNYGTILKNDSSYIVTQLIEEDINIVSDFSLSQNYPNPFNPTTAIKYHIPEFSFVTLKVYDVLGSEVETIVNEEKPAGNYEADFDGANLPSGVYFYQLISGNFIETKKMLLIK